jgi:hypothetical protein
MDPTNRIDQICRCVEMIHVCEDSIKRFNATGVPAPGWPAKDYPLFALIGIMDWVSELHYWIKETQ